MVLYNKLKNQLCQSNKHSVLELKGMQRAQQVNIVKMHWKVYKSMKNQTMSYTLT